MLGLAGYKWGSQLKSISILYDYHSCYSWWQAAVAVKWRRGNNFSNIFSRKIFIGFLPREFPCVTRVWRVVADWTVQREGYKLQSLINQREKSRTPPGFSMWVARPQVPERSILRSKVQYPGLKPASQYNMQPSQTRGQCITPQHPCPETYSVYKWLFFLTTMCQTPPVCSINLLVFACQ